MGDTDSGRSRNKHGKKELSFHQKVVHHSWYSGSLTIRSELCCAITFYYRPQVFTNKIGCLDTVVYQHLFLVKAYINNKIL